MPEFTQPADIARETLRRLALNGMPPTPDNYRATYLEVAGTPTSAGDLRGIFAQLLEDGLGAVIADNQELTEQMQRLAGELRSAKTAEQHAVVAGNLRQLAYRLNFVAEDQAEVRKSLVSLLRMVVENIDELVVDDSWLKGQVDDLLQLVRHPVDVRHLDDVGRRIKEVVYKQGTLKRQLLEAQARLKGMLRDFIDRLAEMSWASAEYQQTIERCALRITQAENIAELTDALDEVMQETRSKQLNVVRSGELLTVLRGRAEDAEKEVTRLREELAQTSEMMRHDTLTGALNRKGMNEALTREMSRARRRQSPMSLGMLDIDNFKQLNDSRGHLAGDAALHHLASVIRSVLRPQDGLARYGGEEFLVLLPDTLLADGVTVMNRLQGELARRTVSHDGQPLSVTFSAGVAQVGLEENAASAIQRADAAMYQAKRQGKNQVIPALQETS